MGSILRIFRITFAWPLDKLSQFLLKNPSTSICKVLCLRILCKLRFYLNFLRYITNLNYTFLSIFADDYILSGKNSYYLMKRNNIRIGKPAKIGIFIISMMKWVIILSGVCLSIILIIYPSSTVSGQLTIEITGISGPLFFSCILSWFIGEVFGGALEVSLITVLLSAACDEEMFVREQRFIEDDLLEFMDKIGEEQNEYHKENMIKIRARSQSTNADKFSIEEIDSYGMGQIVPDNGWKNSSEVSRLNPYEQNLRNNTGDRLVVPQFNSSQLYGQSFQSAQSMSYFEGSLERIQEVSFEEEPQIVQGIAAMYVD